MKHALMAPELPFGAARGGKGRDPAFLLSGAQGGTRGAVRGAESLISDQTDRLPPDGHSPELMFPDSLQNAK